MRILVVALAVLCVGAGTALTHEEQIRDLKQAPPDHQVKAVGYCKGEYQVALKDGMVGDRAFLVFFEPGEMKDFVKKTC